MLIFLSILFISPDNTFPGPISIKFFVPLSIINLTLSNHLTLPSICETNKFLISNPEIEGFAVKLEIIGFFNFFKI